MRLALKSKLPLEILVNPVLVAGGALLSALMKIIRFPGEKEEGPTILYPDCAKAYPVIPGPHSWACQGLKNYAEPDPSPL
jgi:hypothetical protein